VLHSLDDYYAANMDLLKYEPPLNLYQSDWLIRSYVGQHPPARTAPGAYGNEGIFINSIIGAGSVINGSSVQNSILFNNVVVNDEAVVQGSILFDNVRIGNNCHIENCIIEKGVVVPDKTEIGLDKKRDSARFYITPGGLRVIPKFFKDFA
jgi:glucose-1-phosphate adenylyltransferase